MPIQKMKAILLIPIVAITSCTGAYHAVTKTPVPFTNVKRVDGEGPELKVASYDLYKASQKPDDIYGFYSITEFTEVVGKSSK